MSQQLLLDERPLTVQPSLVALVGLERALILQTIHFACQQPRSGKRLDDGQKWVWNTYADWNRDYFTFWSEANIQKHFLRLEKEGYLLSAQPEIRSGSAVKYYRVNYAKLGLQPSCIPVDPIIDQSRPSPLPESTPSSTGVDHLYKDSESSSESSQKRETQPPSLPYGKSQPIPKTWEPTAQLFSQAAVEYPKLDLLAETKKFKLYFQSKGDNRSDWGSAWLKWLFDSETRRKEKIQISGAPVKLGWQKPDYSHLPPIGGVK